MKKWMVLLICFFSSSLVFADWTQFQYNPQHTGATNVLAPQNGELEWALDLGVEISPFGGPSIGAFDNTKLIFLGTDNGVYLIDTNGIIVDSILTDSPVTSVIAINENVIYFGCGDSLMAYLPSEMYWSHYIGGNISHVTIFEDNVYVNGGDKLWSFNLDGVFNWETDILGGGIDKAAPAVDEDGNVYVVTIGDPLNWYDYRLYSFNPDGSQRWIFEYFGLEPGGVRVSPTIDGDNNIYIATRWSSPYWLSGIYSIKDNEQNWRRDAEVMYSSPAFKDSCLYYGTRQGLVARSSNGDLLWEFPSSSPISYSSPAIGNDNTIYVGTDGGLFIALSQGGDLKWSYDTQEGGLGSPAIDSTGTVYVASHTSLFAFADSFVVSIEEDNDQSEDYCFQLQIQPNPFIDKTTISYQLDEAGLVEIAMYNIRGRLVKALVNQYQNQGLHKIYLHLPIEAVTSGIYFIKVESRYDLEIKKIIILK